MYKINKQGEKFIICKKLRVCVDFCCIIDFSLLRLTLLVLSHIAMFISAVINSCNLIRIPNLVKIPIKNLLFLLKFLLKTYLSKMLATHIHLQALGSRTSRQGEAPLPLSRVFFTGRLSKVAPVTLHLSDMLLQSGTENVGISLHKIKTKHTEPICNSINKLQALLCQLTQRSNAWRVRSSCHKFTKENTDECRKFHFNRKS